MLSTSALTWAAAQEGIQVWELMRSLTPTDERRIEAAYAEWRRRAAAGERRHKVDWRSYPVGEEPAEPEAKPVTAVLDRQADTIHTPTEEVADSTPTEEVAEDSADPDVADALEAVSDILAQEPTEPEYVSLDDFNCEPSKAEMKAMEEAIEAEEPEDVIQEEDEELDAPIPDEDTEMITESIPVEEETPVDDGEPVEQRISKLAKDASSSIYEDILVSLGSDVAMAKAVTEAVMRDHTRRHRGTAAQRLFLAWLNDQQ